MTKKVVTVLALAAFSLAVTGCNTVEGAGRDIKAGGAAIEKAAEKSKPK